MKVFISWSGTRSKAVAKLLHEYVKVVVDGVTPFMSEEDIEPGQRWSERIATELDDSSYGIMCVTPENRKSEWLLFEAGAVSKHKGRVSSLLIGGLKPTDFNNPLTQFQNLEFNKPNLERLFLKIAEAAGVDTNTTKRRFELVWHEIESKYNNILPLQHQESTQNARSDREIIEELLLRQRNTETGVFQVNAKVYDLSLSLGNRLENSSLTDAVSCAFAVEFASTPQTIDLEELKEFVDKNVGFHNKYMWVTNVYELPSTIGSNKAIRFTVFGRHFPHHRSTIRNGFRSALVTALDEFLKTSSGSEYKLLTIHDLD